MLRTLAMALVLLSLTTAARSDPAPDTPNKSTSIFSTTPHPDSHRLRPLGLEPSRSAPAALACCKVCTIGKACGDTCISRDKTCHVGQGCACDG